jgi:hypothetical protein
LEGALEALFNLFLKEKQFLNGIILKTMRSYQRAINAYQRDDLPQTTDSFRATFSKKSAVTSLVSVVISDDPLADSVG